MVLSSIFRIGITINSMNQVIRIHMRLTNRLKSFNRIPKWVSTFPHEMDRMALTQLAKNSKGPFEKEREMNFSLFDFETSTPFEEVGAKIEEHGEGWVYITQPQAEAPGRVALTATKKDYTFTQSNYITDVAFFQQLARMYGAQYDGWFASN